MDMFATSAHTWLVLLGLVLFGCGGGAGDGGTDGAAATDATTTDAGDTDATATDSGPAGTDSGPAGTDSGMAGTDSGLAGTDSGTIGTDAGTSGPTLLEATYFGGNDYEVFRDCVVAPGGDVILVGASGSSNFPATPGVYSSTQSGGGDAMLVRMSGDLSSIVAATLIGGSGWEKNTYGVDIDGMGNIYATGETRSSDFPTTAGTVQPGFGGGMGDAFAIKMSSDLTMLLYSTYLGGSNLEAGRGGLDVDTLGNAYIVGWTESSDFPTTAGSYQPAWAGGFYDGFIAALSPDGSTFLYSTLIGGSWGSAWQHSEYVVGAKLDSIGNLLFVGSSTSADFPTTPGSFDTVHSGNGTADAFAACMSGSGAVLLWASLVSGSANDWTEHQMAVDATNSVYIVGAAGSTDFPTTAGAAQTTFGGGGEDIFVAKIAANGTSVIWATYVGGSGAESAFGIHLDAGNNVYIGGLTTSPDFPVTPDAAQSTLNAGGQDAILVRISADGSAIDYATYLGGSGSEVGRFVCGSGTDVYVTGSTDSSDFPTSIGSAQPGFGGVEDSFIFHVGF